jgi:heterodisulfide reductase subunit C
MTVGLKNSKYARQSHGTITQVKKKMTGYGYEDCSGKGNEEQVLDTIMRLGRKMISHDHMRNIEKDYNQVKKDVQLKGIQNTSQKGNDKEFAEIMERFSKLEKLIQESKEHEYYGWVMKRKRVQWFALQQR